jgi:hypothetical protein
VVLEELKVPRVFISQLFGEKVEKVGTMYSPLLTPIWSVYTLLFGVTSAHTLLGSVILLLIQNGSLLLLVKKLCLAQFTIHYVSTILVHALCLDQLYWFIFIFYSSLCSVGDCVVYTTALYTS